MLKDLTCIEIENYVKSKVSPSRFEHCISVAETAVFFNNKFNSGFISTDCYKCGLLHDVARNWTYEDLLLYCGSKRIKIEKEELENPVLLHAPVGASIASSLGYESYETAIRWHTLGSVEMGRLGLIIYLSDYLEPKRSFLTDKDRLVYNRMESLEVICLKILKNIKKHMKKKNQQFASSTTELYEYLQNGGTF